MRLPPESSNAGSAEERWEDDVRGDMEDDELTKTERGKRGLEDLRALLNEIAAVGMPESHVGIKIDAAHAMEGLDRAKRAIEEFEREEWSRGCENKKDHEKDADREMKGYNPRPEALLEDEVYRNTPHEGRAIPHSEDEVDIGEALAELRAAVSDELREASMEDVLAAAETGLRDSGTLYPDDVVRIEDEIWQIAPALRALYDHELDVNDVLKAITAESDTADYDEDVHVIDHEAARMVLARMHVVDALPPRDGERRSVEEIADKCDRDEEYVRDELERLAEWGVADLGWDGARLAHKRVVVEPLVREDE